ncbi:5'-methylthioadenosine/adenosylhomocysteine nucleosidase [Stratiformator vulcanicus]|uniref:adenosylhomocysteine nucleosidase n=1 Tax=Stratiformator vulcanicus TaxID=2527980 RepID=A0A517R5I2_9PLAN|nr:5'-methylthioadenosine/adenosylhomocysteine nucleosidase [Stratiformator vulcanicus]QDT39110.1 5'-methylthioadenosine/S-adenosylhomocysteine nucleosidase [Stratiformator vulcanicus]
MIQSISDSVSSIVARATGIIASLIFLAAAATAADRAPVAILGAMDVEVDGLIGAIDDRQTREILGLKFHEGVLEGTPVVVARGGVGKVNAAMVTTLLIEHFRPEVIVFTGVAGAVNPELRPGDIVIGKSALHHDFGTHSDEAFVRDATRNPVDGKLNPVQLPAPQEVLAAMLEAAETVQFRSVDSRMPQFRTGIVGTGDVFLMAKEPRRELRKTLGIDVVEMEGAAAAQVGHQLGVPVIIIRAISDRADKNAQLDFRRFAAAAAANNIRLVRSFLKIRHKTKH